MKITQKQTGYDFHFDSKYCFNKGDNSKYETLSSLDKKDAKCFSNAFPVILDEMDNWFACHPKAEREFQHRLIKSNTNKPAIVDIEYAGRTSNGKLFRLDMLGIYKAEDGYRISISGTASLINTVPKKSASSKLPNRNLLCVSEHQCCNI